MDSDLQMTLHFDEFDRARGLYEPDLLYENNWKRRWACCRKHPGHRDFIPRQDFCMQNLPGHAQHPEIFDYFKCTADLTCYLEMSYVSWSRSERFPFAAFRGQHRSSPMVGSGMVSPEGTKLRTDKPCPCGICKSSKNPQRAWAEVLVRTVAHNVCDHLEAEATRVKLFYDTEVKGGAVGGHSLDGVGVYKSNVSEDWCLLLCATHDMDLYNIIKDLGKRRGDLRVKAAKKYKELGAQGKWPDNVCVIPSHPHGSYKHLTVGKVDYTQTDKEENKKKQDALVYRTCTCPGSSGAPVAFVGDADRMFERSNGDLVPVKDGPYKFDGVGLFYLYLPPHSGATGTSGVNMSGWV